MEWKMLRCAFAAATVAALSFCYAPSLAAAAHSAGAPPAVAVLWLGGAQMKASQGLALENAGNFAGALASYREATGAVQTFVTSTVNDDPRVTEGYLVLGSTHIDAARMLSKIGASRNPEMQIELNAAERALAEAVQHNQVNLQNAAARNRNLPIQQRAICCDYSATIYAAYGDLRLLGGDERRGREAYQAALRSNPSANKPRLALEWLDAVHEVRGGGRAAASSPQHPRIIAMLRSEYTRQGVVEIVKVVTSDRFGKMAGTLTGIATDAVIKYFQASQ